MENKYAILATVIKQVKILCVSERVKITGESLSKIKATLDYMSQCHEREFEYSHRLNSLIVTRIK